MEAGVGILMRTSQRMQLRLAYHWGRSSSALGVGAGTASFELQVGSFDEGWRDAAFLRESP
jgi:hypothetical protein